MIIIVGGEPELSYGMVQRGAGWLGGRVGSVPAHMHYMCASLVRNGAHVVLYVEMCEKGLYALTGMLESSFLFRLCLPCSPLSSWVSLSLQPRSLLVSPLLFAFLSSAFSVL